MSAAEVAAAVADAHRREWAFVLAATVRVTRDIDLAEECVQEAYARALSTWQERGLPANPAAWLTTTARNRALDVLRRETTLRRTVSRLGVEIRDLPDVADEVDLDEIADDRLRLICTCCHPALPQEAQMALTLRLLCGLTTAEVARAFLVSESTMAARITRAKKKITAAKIPYRVPPADELPERLTGVLGVVHLLFTTGHTAPAGTDLVRRDLVERATDLARMLRTLLPSNADVAGLLALILLTDARRATRLDRTGRLLLLSEQDRSQWNQSLLADGLALVQQAITLGPRSSYALQAAIAAVHAGAPSWDATDWDEVVRLYDQLCEIWPSPVVGLNRAVAVSLASGPAAGLAALDAIAGEPELAGYGYLPAARADMLVRLERYDEAAAAYQSALALTTNEVERSFLQSKLEEISRSSRC